MVANKATCQLITFDYLITNLHALGLHGFTCLDIFFELLVKHLQTNFLRFFVVVVYLLTNQFARIYIGLLANQPTCKGITLFYGTALQRTTLNVTALYCISYIILYIV